MSATRSSGGGGVSRCTTSVVLFLDLDLDGVVLVVVAAMLVKLRDFLEIVLVGEDLLEEAPTIFSLLFLVVLRVVVVALCARGNILLFVDLLRRVVVIMLLVVVDGFFFFFFFLLVVADPS